MCHLWPLAGMGFLSVNRIGPLLNDMNIDVTFEGDNTVLMQQVELHTPPRAAQRMWAFVGKKLS